MVTTFPRSPEPGTNGPTDGLTARHIFDVRRHRWDQENVHCELTKHWGIKHNFVHHPVASQAVMLLIAIAYNLFGLFLHRCLGKKSRKHYTAVEIVEQMKQDYSRIGSRTESGYP